MFVSKIGILLVVVALFATTACSGYLEDTHFDDLQEVIDTLDRHTVKNCGYLTGLTYERKPRHGCYMVIDGPTVPTVRPWTVVLKLNPKHERADEDRRYDEKVLLDHENQKTIGWSEMRHSMIGGFPLARVGNVEILGMGPTRDSFDEFAIDIGDLRACPSRVADTRYSAIGSYCMVVRDPS